MNAELFDLLRQLGVPADGAWHDVLMLENYAPVPPLPTHKALHWQRGFNLAILVHGKPEYFVKCRPAHDPVLQRATATRSVLAGHRPGGVSVSDARFASSERISVQVARFLRGPSFGAGLRTEDAATLQHQIRNILRSHADLARLARQECEYLRAPTETISLEAASLGSCAYLRQHDILDEQAAGTLAGVMSRSGSVTLLPQHGDFWFQNLLVVAGDVWVIDFEEYGQIQVPLFDDLTLVLATLARRAGGRTEGLRRFLAPDPEGQAWRQLIAERAAAERIEPSQMDGILIFYLTQMAEQIHRRGGMTFGGPHLAALRYAADQLVAGNPAIFDGRSK